jgi:hypothetical protein
MNRPRDDNEPWPDTVRTGADSRERRDAPSREELLAPSTQVVADRDAYLGQGRNDVGRRISDDQVELFVTGDAAPSLQRELELHASEFIAVHDVGASASLRLLAGLAGASHSLVQKLTVRRQGYGLALAVLQFVEVPLSAGGVVRVYSTDASADGPTRQALARTLLAHSRLGVLVTGEVPSHVLATALHPLREAIARGPWTNQELLLVPLGSSGALASQASAMSAGSGVAVQITPQAVRPKHIWNFIAGAWNRLTGATQPGAARAMEADIERAVPKPPPSSPEAPTQPMRLRTGVGADASPYTSTSTSTMRSSLHDPATELMPPPASSGGAARSMPSPGGTKWQDYVERCMAIKGAVSCCVFDIPHMKPLAFAGHGPTGERLAQQGTNLLVAAGDSARALGLGSGQPEVSLSTSGHHLIVRAVPGHPGVAAHIVVLASAGNLTLARMQLERIEAPQ